MLLSTLDVYIIEQKTPLSKDCFMKKKERELHTLNTTYNNTDFD